MIPPPPDNSAANPEAGLTRRDALVIGTGAAATAFLPASAVSPFDPGLQAAEPYEPAYDGDLEAFPDDWVDTMPAGTVPSRAPSSPVGTILKEYRIVGCPMFGCTQRNVNKSWQGGWYYSFRAPKTGTITKFMWQTQGARKHGEPGEVKVNGDPNQPGRPPDDHTNGNFGHYSVKFYAYTGFGAKKGSQLAQGRFASGESAFYPGWQLTSTGTSSPPYTPAAYPAPDSSHYGGRPETAQLRGGLHVHAWLNRTVPYPRKVGTYHPYAGTAFVYVDVDSFSGGSWTVNAGDWIIAEFVNLDSDSTSNFSGDNNASSIGAPRPGNFSQGSPLDGKLAIIKYIGTPASGQPDSILATGKDIVPFFLLGYSDAKWHGQPWYYRGRSRYAAGSGKDNGGLFDVDGKTGTLLSTVGDRGPALLVFGPNRLRQILTPPSSYAAALFSEICIHAWRWTDLNSYTFNGRLGVRILRVGTVSGQDTTSGLTKIWPKSGASGSNIFFAGGGSSQVGPFGDWRESPAWPR